MKWIQVGAGLAALSLASYATAAPPEARLLGASVGLPGGTAPSKSAAPPTVAAFHPAGKGAIRYGRALARLQADSQAATRGATETRVYQRAAPAVVLVLADEALGSGALISADGKILTNLHVVGDAKEVGVIFKPAIEGAAIGKADVRRAKVLRRDDVADLALIQVAEVPTGVTPLPIGESSSLQVGADVHAIGHPTGETWTYTRGVVSQIRRAFAWKTEDKILHEATVVQTQTPINPGNSGGPLLDDNGAIVGVNSFVADGEGLNYAVSAEDVKSFLARGHDRLTATQTRAAAAKACKGVTLDQGPNDKPKGVAYLRDADCDGEADLLVIVPSDMKQAIIIWADEDGDGKYEAMYFDDDRDGHPEEALWDTDGNGKPDMRGDFRNGEDEPYRWERYAEN